jgi:molybdopterin synthase catalytic subunit
MSVGIHKKGEITLVSLISLLEKNPEIEKTGAVAIFCGRVRGFTHENKKVVKLEVETFKEEAERVLNQISEKLKKNPGIIEVLIHHMIGTFSVGEDMVYVIVAGKSRKDVFTTLVDAVEKYKHESPIWKKEYLVDGSSYWVSEKN